MASGTADTSDEATADDQGRAVAEPVTERVLRVTLELKITSLDAKQCAELARDIGYGAGEELADISEYHADEIAYLLEALGAEGLCEDIFAGSNIFAKFADCHIVDAQFVEQPASPDRSQPQP